MPDNNGRESELLRRGYTAVLDASTNRDLSLDWYILAMHAGYHIRRAYSQKDALGWAQATIAAYTLQIHQVPMRRGSCEAMIAGIHASMIQRYGADPSCPVRNAAALHQLVETAISRVPNHQAFVAAIGSSPLRDAAMVDLLWLLRALKKAGADSLFAPRFAPWFAAL